MKKEQFKEFMSTYSVEQIKKALILQQDKDVLDIDKKRIDILNQKEIDFNDLAIKLRSITKTEDLIYKLSNQFMDIGEDGGLPYHKIMILPIIDKWVNILILVKTISSINRLHKYYNQDTPVITQDTLEQLNYKLTIDQLVKILDVLGGFKITHTNNGIQININSFWSALPLKGPGYIQYDMSRYENKITIAQSYLESIQESFKTHELSSL